MAVQLTTQMAALAGLFSQAPSHAAPAAFDQNVQGTVDLLQLLITRRSFDITGITTPAAAAGFLPGLDVVTGAPMAVPAGKMWIVLGLTSSTIPGVDNVTFATACANAAGSPLLCSANVTVVLPMLALINGFVQPSLPVFLKAGDQVGAWFSGSVLTGGSTTRVNARIVEFDAY
jgi:hypothetical protein